MTKTFEIELFDTELVVECDYIPAEKGDYLYPGAPSDIEVTSIELLYGGDVTNLILNYIDDAETAIKEEIFDKYEV